MKSVATLTLIKEMVEKNRMKLPKSFYKNTKISNILVKAIANT